MTYSIADLKKIILGKYNIQGDENKKFIKIAPLTEATESDLAFCSLDNATALEAVINSQASIIICKNNLNIHEIVEKTFILVENPRYEIINIIEKLFTQTKKGILHESALIGDKCKIGKNVEIGPYSVIGNNVKIGTNARIGSNCTIHDNTIISENVRITSGCVIGSSGFGYEKHEKKWVNFPHIGNVIIKKNVDVGANTCIDRGTLGSTIIEEGVKIDNLVHIAHNVNIGKNSVIITQSCIAGSVVIGANCWIAPGVIIRNGIKIGNNVTVGMGAVVTKDIKDDDIVMGIPAKSIKKID